MPDSGYSGTPLLKKLGIKPEHRFWAIGAPTGYAAWLGGDIPAKMVEGLPADIVHIFAVSRRELAETFRRVTTKADSRTVIWISWYKKSAKKDTDITEDVIREIVLPTGWVDVKVCAVSDEWSGLKMVKRVVNR